MNEFNAFRFASLLVLLVVLAVAGWIFRGVLWNLISKIKASSSEWAVFLVVFFVCWNIFASKYLFISLLDAFFLISLLISAVLIAFFSRRLSAKVFLVFGGCVIAFIAAYSLFAIDYVAINHQYITRRTVTPGFPQVRLYSDVVVGIMPLATLYIFARQRPSVFAALLCFVPLVVLWYFLFLSEGRSGVLSLCFAMAVALVLLKRSALWPVGVLFGSALIGLISWWLYNPLIRPEAQSLFQRDITSNNGRYELWFVALRHGFDNFPLGIGPMHYAGDGRLSYAHAHNVILNTAAEWGLPIALMLLALILYGCWKIYRRSQVIPDQDKPIYASLVMAFVGVIVNVQFAGAHILPLSSLVMALAIGLVFGYRDSHQPLPQRHVGPVPIQATLLWAGMMLMMAYLLHAGMELYWLSLDSRLLCMQEVGRAYLYPRFWAQGRLECMQMVAPDHWLFWTWR